MTQYLTAEQALFIHARLIEETGGSSGIRDLGLLRSAVSRPQATFAQEELYPNILLKAAALLESLVNNHPFVDGNKRTGITASALFLQANGYKLNASQKELSDFTLSIAKGVKNIESISLWLERHTE